MTLLKTYFVINYIINYTYIFICNLLKYTYTYLLFTDTTDSYTPPDDQYLLETTLFVILLLGLNIYFLYLLVKHVHDNTTNEQKCYINTTLYNTI